MSKPLFHHRAEVVSAFTADDDAGRTLEEAPSAVSTTPIAIGAALLLVGAWLLATAIGNPHVDPSQALGTEVRASTEPTVVPVPAELNGLVDVFAQSADGGDFALSEQFVVVDDEGERVPGTVPLGGVVPEGAPDTEYASTDLDLEEGRPGDRYQLVAAVEVGAGERYTVVVASDWEGRVAFVLDDDPPTAPNWKAIILLVLFCLASAGLVVVWTIRRRRWKVALAAHRAELERRGYVVD